MAKLLFIAFAISSIVASVAHGAAVPAELEVAGKAARTACIEETGATEDMLENASKGEFADDEKLKCYFKCVLDKFTLIEGDDLKIDAMLELVPAAMKEVATKSIESCRDTSGSDICDKSYNFNKCLYQQNPEHYFVV